MTEKEEMEIQKNVEAEFLKAQSYLELNLKAVRFFKRVLIEEGIEEGLANKIVGVIFIVLDQEHYDNGIFALLARTSAKNIVKMTEIIPDIGEDNFIKKLETHKVQIVANRNKP